MTASLNTKAPDVMSGAYRAVWRWHFYPGLLCLPFVLWLAATGRGHFGASLHDTAFLVGAGAVTAIPLMMYANAAKLIRLSTIGILQYIAPTLIFLTAVLIFHEPFGGVRRIAGPCRSKNGLLRTRPDTRCASSAPARRS